MTGGAAVAGGGAVTVEGAPWLTAAASVFTVTQRTPERQKKSKHSDPTLTLTLPHVSEGSSVQFVRTWNMDYFKEITHRLVRELRLDDGRLKAYYYDSFWGSVRQWHRAALLLRVKLCGVFRVRLVLGEVWWGDMVQGKTDWMDLTHDFHVDYSKFVSHLIFYYQTWGG